MRPHSAYYNEIDPYAAQWLRNLIRGGHIAPGDVDERTIEDVHPDDLRPYTQCHFFAGIGAWSLALRRAGWPDSRPVWTGSCPCQPFSSAGQGAGFDDPRHLWPSFGWLIREHSPSVVFGEQVASKDAEPWLDLVQADVETMGYAFGAIPFPSASVGAPHIRDRLFWAADTNLQRQRSAGNTPRTGNPSRGGKAIRLDNSNDTGLERHTGDGGAARRQGSERPAPEAGISGRVANLHGNRCDQAGQCQPATGNDGADGNGGIAARVPTAGPVNGLWSDADWLFCRDGKWRPVEPGTFPLADGAASRVGRLRAYGNAINVEAATQFIAAYLDSTA